MKEQVKPEDDTTEQAKYQRKREHRNHSDQSPGSPNCLSVVLHILMNYVYFALQNTTKSSL